jgi:hypothetical protein
MDVVVSEHALPLLGPLLFAQAVLNPALALAELSSYLSFHLKYLLVRGDGQDRRKPIAPQTPRYFKFFHAPKLRGPGETLVQGLDPKQAYLSDFDAPRPKKS